MPGGPRPAPPAQAATAPVAHRAAFVRPPGRCGAPAAASSFRPILSSADASALASVLSAESVREREFSFLLGRWLGVRLPAQAAQ